MTDHCDVQTFFWVWTKLLPLHGCDVMCFGVMCLWFDLLSSDVASCEVICGTTPVLLCTTKNYNVLLQYYSNVLLRTTTYYSSTTLYYKVLLRYFSVLQSTTPALLCTTKYYASTTLYYKVLLRYYSVLCHYYSVLQSTTPVLLCTTKYYASTTTYYPVLQRTTPVLLWNVIYNAVSNKRHHPTSPNTAPATQNESRDWSAWHMKRHLQCAEQKEAPSNFTKYCACHANWIASLIRITYATSFPMRGASKVTLQLHQILTQNASHPWSASHMKRHFQCVEQVKSPSNLTNYCACHKILRCRFHVKVSEVLPPIERRFEDNPRISDDKIVISHPPLRRPYSSHLGDDFVL